MHLPQAHLLNTFLPLFGHLGPHVYMKINGILSLGPLQGDRIHHEIVKVGVAMYLGKSDYIGSRSSYFHCRMHPKLTEQ